MCAKVCSDYMGDVAVMSPRLEVIVVVLLTSMWLVFAGCERRTDEAETQEQSSQKSHRSAEEKGTNLEAIRFEIIDEKELLGMDGNRMLSATILLQERLGEEELVSFMSQMKDSYRAYENATINVVASRGAYEEWTKHSSESGSDREVWDRILVVGIRECAHPLMTRSIAPC